MPAQNSLGATGVCMSFAGTLVGNHGSTAPVMIHLCLHADHVAEGGIHIRGFGAAEQVDKLVAPTIPLCTETVAPEVFKHRRIPGCGCARHSNICDLPWCMSVCHHFLMSWLLLRTYTISTVATPLITTAKLGV